MKSRLLLCAFLLLAPTLPAQEPSSAPRPLIVSTWPFGKKANERALEVYLDSGSGLNAIEKGINLIEEDKGNASVGIGGIPNADGVVQLDACIMNGPTHGAGSVAGIEDILHPISVARMVMERTPHVMLVGAGARAFALENGMEAVDLMTEARTLAWEKWKAEQAAQPPVSEDNHDTIAMVLLDENGDLFGGCSTSGWGYKVPGRVGDSPIIGSGLYVDNAVGAAGATGLGENVMRFCSSFLIVEFMRQGATPQEACEMGIQRVASMVDTPMEDLAINFIAIDKKGNVGAAGTGQGFDFSVTQPGLSEVRRSVGLTKRVIEVIGGNQ